MDLPYLAKHYRIKFTRDELAFHLVESKFGAKLSWTSGLCLTNTVLNMSVPLPPRITVPFWKVAKLRSLLQIPHFFTIQILTDTQNRFMDVLVLRKMQTPQIATIPGADTCVSTSKHFICLIFLHPVAATNLLIITVFFTSINFMVMSQAASVPLECYFYLFLPAILFPYMVVHTYIYYVIFCLVMPFLHIKFTLYFSPNASFLIIFAVVCYTGCEWCHERTI